MQLRLLLDAALDFIYPRIYCVCCGERLEKRAVHGICDNCCEAMPFIHDPRCHVCGKPAPEESETCPECRYHNHEYDRALAVFEYSATIRELIHRFKYNKEYTLSRTFGYFMTELLMECGWTADMIIPVPLHKNRLKSRGFNQSALLGDYLSQRINIPCEEDILIRSIDTKTQTGFHRQDRLKNLKNAFTVICPEKVEGRNILLVDDVHTTGATVDSCSKELRRAGAGKIYVITAAAVLSDLATGRRRQ
jgi:competence protein ComFC